jgi:hypothetical protein
MSLTGLFTSRSRQRLARELENARRFSDSPFSWDWDERRDLYTRWQALYDNTIYDSQTDGGFREIVLREVFGIESTVVEDPPGSAIGPYFNPIKPIVDAYQNVLMGAFGKDIKVAPQFNGTDVTPVLLQDADNPIGSVWKWSNLDTEKQTLQRNAACFGACGIRVVADPNAGAGGQVTLQFDHPSRIVDFDTDARGNVTAVLLQYQLLSGALGGERQEVDVEERLDTDSFRQTFNGKTVTETPNPFGFCPYVILRHGPRGEWGVPAFYGSETPIHLINRLRAEVRLGVSEVIDATWFATAAGRAPEIFKFGRKRVAYVQTQPDSPNPSLEPLVAPLNIGEAALYADGLEDRVQQRQPEMVIGNLQALSGQSGETIAKLLKPAEAKILEARAPYEHALIRALQMALSELIVMGQLNVGTGSGSSDAADKAYEQGKLNFEFEERPALPMTPFDVAQQATADTAKRTANLANAKSATGLVDNLEQLRIAGYSEEEAKAILQRKRTTDAVPSTQL